MTGSEIHKLSLKQLCKQYGPVVALHETDLDVRSGEFVTLLGPSGSGKTTLLKLIAGMTRPSSGTILIDGRDATSLPAQARDLGMVFQNYALMPHMTVFDNVAFPLRVRKIGREEIKRKVEGALGIVRLPHLANRKPAELSGGQQQRVSIARAIVYDPSLVLMDEPLGALDKKLREQLQTEIKQLHHQLGITILYVTHDQQEAMAMSDRVALMNNGSIEQLGKPQELYFSPKTQFVADFLGDSNFFDAKFVELMGDRAIYEMASGDQVRAGGVPGLKRGDRVQLVVRPEHINFATDDDLQLNTISATASNVTFLGGFIQYRAKHGEREIVFLGSNEDLSKDFQTGAMLRLQWPPERTLVFRT